ncbi:MAG: hypothetical protein AAGA47_09005 [Pseudomonadota bacterium]
MRIVILLLMVVALAACGGRSNRAPAGLQFSQGPISAACESSGRESANRALCGCIQSVANRELNGSDQRRGASFFGDPARAHEVRLDDSPAADAFWRRWTDFAETAEGVCRAAL